MEANREDKKKVVCFKDMPRKNAGEIYKGITNDLEVMMHLQHATKKEEKNDMMIPICSHRHADCDSPRKKNAITNCDQQSSQVEQREIKLNFPREDVLIKVAYSPPKRKQLCSKIKGARYCHKHSKCLLPNKIHSHVDCCFMRESPRDKNKCITQGEQAMKELELIKNKLKITEDALKSEVKAKMKATEFSEKIKDNYDSLCQDFNKYKKDICDIHKLKTENSCFKHQICVLKKEKDEINSLLECKCLKIEELEKNILKLKCESAALQDKGENRCKELQCENCNLARKVKELDSELTNVTVEACKREEFYKKELSKRPTLDEVEANDTMMKENCKKFKLLICEKEDLLEKANKKNKDLQEKLLMYREADKRNCLKEEELKKINCALEEKLTKLEQNRKALEFELLCTKEEWEDKLCDVEREKEATITELSKVMEQQTKCNAEVLADNKQLQERINDQICCLEKKDNQIVALRNRIIELSDELEDLQESVLNKDFDVSKEVKSQQSIIISNEADEILKLLDTTEKELDKARKNLECEKQEVCKRDKIICDYELTLKKIKDEENKRNEELEKRLQEKEASERNMRISFCQERRQNEKLLDEITKLKWQEQCLCEQLNETSAQLAMYEEGCLEKEAECQEHARMLGQIEDEVELKTAEWCNYVNKLMAERDAAINTARLAQQKLMTAAAEFQRHSCAQKKMQQVLVTCLKQRERELQCALQKITKLKGEVLNTVHCAISIKKNVGIKIQKACEVLKDLTE